MRMNAITCLKNKNKTKQNTQNKTGYHLVCQNTHLTVTSIHRVKRSNIKCAMNAITCFKKKIKKKKQKKKQDTIFILSPFKAIRLSHPFHWTIPFPILGLLGDIYRFCSDFRRTSSTETVKTLVRHRLLWRLIIRVCTLCP